MAAIGWLAHSLSGLAHFEEARDALVPCLPQIAISVSTLLTLPRSPQLAQFATCGDDGALKVWGLSPHKLLLARRTDGSPLTFTMRFALSRSPRATLRDEISSRPVSFAN